MAFSLSTVELHYPIQLQCEEDGEEKERGEDNKLARVEFLRQNFSKEKTYCMSMLDYKSLIYEICFTKGDRGFTKR